MPDNGTRIPKLTPQGPNGPAKLETLPLSSIDGYVMSRIDGATTERDLAGSTGLTEESINDALGKLEFLGLIEYAYAPPPTPEARAPRSPAPPPPKKSAPTPQPTPQNQSATGSSQPRPAPTAAARAPASPAAPPPPPPASLSGVAGHDAKDLDEAIDIEPAHRKKILELYAQLDTSNHYELLGVRRNADKKAIKRAYFELAAVFHPDKYFRKNLGTYKPKLEAVFGRLSQANDILTSKQRAEYDEYLGDVEVTQRLESGIAEAEALELKMVAEKTAQDAQLILVTKKAQELVVTSTAKAGPPPRIEDLLSDALAAMAGGADGAGSDHAVDLAGSDLGGFGEVGPLPGFGSSPPPPQVAPARPSSPSTGGAAHAPSPGASGATGRLTPNAQREAFARRLLGQARPAPRPLAPVARAPGPATTPVHHQMSSAEAVEALRRRYRERVSDARRGQAQKHADNGALAMEAKDPVAAANAYRLAVTLLPEDEALKSAFETAQTAADLILSESYTRAAGYEEKNEDWVGAAKSWSKVAKARAGDARAHERAAACMVKANADMHEAARLGSRAVALEPNNANYRVTLANVYMHAGLPKNARRELETAIKISPDDANIQTLLKRAQKGV